MDNDSGALILLIVLIVSAFLLIVIKLTQFVNRFNREKQYFLTEMSRAADYNEYRYWHRELRCLYLCLIPFVTERNVMKVYPVFFHRAKHAAKKKRSDGLMHILAPSMLAICICAICLCGASWAWFTASTSTGTTAIQAASYSVNVSAENESVKIASESGTFTVTFTTAGSYTITLTPSGTAGTGYCKINFADVDHYTDQLTSDSLRFTVNADADSKLTITPQWGCYSGTATIQGGDVITVAADGSQQSNTQTPDRRVTAGPSTEPSTELSTEPSTEPTAPTAPNAHTTPSSAPTESETSTPEPSAHAPTPAQSETPDTYQNPAPEDADFSADTEKTELSDTHKSIILFSGYRKR